MEDRTENVLISGSNVVRLSTFHENGDIGERESLATFRL